jgi:hypothetical protein
MAYNNTYDFEAITLTQYEEALGNWSATGGCKDQVVECQALLELYDPLHIAFNSSVNEVCANAYLFCFENIHAPYEVSGVSTVHTL